MKRAHSQNNVATISDGSDPITDTSKNKGGKRQRKISCPTNFNCEICKKPCNNELQCYLCSKIAHLKCCGVPSVNSDVAMQIVRVLGWACMDCKSLFKVNFQQGLNQEAQMRNLTKDVASLKVQVEKMNGVVSKNGHGVENLSSKPAGSNNVGEEPDRTNFKTTTEG